MTVHSPDGTTVGANGWCEVLLLCPLHSAQERTDPRIQTPGTRKANADIMCNRHLMSKNVDTIRLFRINPTHDRTGNRCPASFSTIRRRSCATAAKGESAHCPAWNAD